MTRPYCIWVLLALFIGTGRYGYSTTLVVIYSPSDGAILATDSCIGSTTVEKVQRGRAIPTEFKTGCKIETCGRYLVAAAGFGQTTEGEGLTRICSNFTSTRDIESLQTAFVRTTIEELNRYVSYLLSNKQEPANGDVLFHCAIAGFEGNRPVMRYFDIAYGGFAQGRLHFQVTNQTACPNDADCLSLNRIAGVKDAILAKNGSYKNLSNHLLLAEELVQIEIDANKKTGYVLPPISVVQFKTAEPYWFRRGLCARR